MGLCASIFFAFLCEITAKKKNLQCLNCQSVQQYVTCIFFVDTDQQAAAVMTNFFLNIYF